jgi:hypothetical protein
MIGEFGERSQSFICSRTVSLAVVSFIVVVIKNKAKTASLRSLSGFRAAPPLRMLVSHENRQLHMNHSSTDINVVDLIEMPKFMSISVAARLPSSFQLQLRGVVLDKSGHFGETNVDS